MGGILDIEAPHARHIAKVGAVLVVLFPAAGCERTVDEQEPLDGDPVMYAEQVQPVVRAHCAYLGCHGREGMPLTLYAADYLRMRDPEGALDPARPDLDERALSDAELAHNRRAIAARVHARDRETFLRRLVPESEGGIRHAGVVVFEDPDAGELDVLRRFAESVR